MDVHAYSRKGSDLRSQTEERPIIFQMNMDMITPTKTPEIKSENWYVIWLNDENHTFIVVDKIDYSLVSVQFVRFSQPDFDVDVYKKKRNESNGLATKYIHNLLDDDTKFIYVDIPEDFIVFNNNRVVTHEVITDTDVITQQKYTIVPPHNRKMYKFAWSQHPATRESGKLERKPDGFTFMYQSKPFFSMTNVITDVWGCTNINKENWSFGKY